MNFTHIERVWAYKTIEEPSLEFSIHGRKLIAAKPGLTSVDSGCLSFVCPALDVDLFSIVKVEIPSILTHAFGRTEEVKWGGGEYFKNWTGF